MSQFKVYSKSYSPYIMICLGILYYDYLANYLILGREMSCSTNFEATFIATTAANQKLKCARSEPCYIKLFMKIRQQWAARQTVFFDYLNFLPSLNTNLSVSSISYQLALTTLPYSSIFPLYNLIFLLLDSYNRLCLWVHHSLYGWIMVYRSMQLGQ